MTIADLHSGRFEGILALIVVVCAAASYAAYVSIARIAAKPVPPIEKELPLVAPGIVFMLGITASAGALNFSTYILTESRLAEMVVGCFAGFAIILIAKHVSAMTLPFAQNDRPSRTMAIARRVFLAVMGVQFVTFLLRASLHPTIDFANELLIAMQISVIPAGIAMYAWRERNDARNHAI